MLVLSRRKGERILIGREIIIEVTEIRGDKTRIGITAPPDVPIWREELRQAVSDEPPTKGK